jgi:predicted dehydrogenase
MARRTVGIVMNGVTGRMGYRQHLVRSILALRDQGGLLLADGTLIWPEPVLVGRNAEKLKSISERHQLANWTTDLDSALGDPGNEIYFDAQLTQLRFPAVRRALAAGQHVYVEKPVAATLPEALELARLARDGGLRNGVVQDKIFLPGLIKLRRLVDAGFFGRILSVRGEFGYWVFEGDWQQAQRPSWNYRAADGGGIVLDMFPHWHYVLERLVGPVRSVYAHAVTHLPSRWDEQGRRYAADADDAAYAVFGLDDGVVAQINSSWAVRVHRDELVEFQIDGTEGSAVAGLRDCVFQHRAGTPKPVWNPDEPGTERFRDQWQPVPDNAELGNGFRAQWELFLDHVVRGTPFGYDLLAGARGVQLAELGLASAREGRRMAVPELSL